MSPLWILPVVVVAAGMAAVAVAAQRAAVAAGELGRGVHDLAQLGEAAAALRDDALAVQAAARNLRPATAAVPGDR